MAQLPIHQELTMAQYQYSGRSNPCPICDRTKDKDCRWNEEVVFCHSHIDQDAQVKGYVYRGATNDGLWGQYFAAAAKPTKPVRPRRKQDYFYPSRDGQPLVKVTRVDQGTGSKYFVQQRWDGQEWVKKLTPEVKQQVTIYRYREVQRAIAAGQPIWMVEGEGCADALWRVGIPATTTLGGSKKYRSYGNYNADLKEARLVLCPDQDQVGLAHMAEIYEDFPQAQWCYVYPDSWRWQNLPKHGGLDIADWITDGATAEQVRAAVGERRQLNPDPPASNQLLDVPALQTQIRDYLAQAPSELELSGQVVQWHREVGLSAKDLWSLIKPIQAELEQVEERDERMAEISQLLKIGDYELQLDDYLHADLAEPLTQIANWIGATPAAMLVTLLPVAASLLQIGTELEIDAGMGFYVPPILFTGLVAPSGSKKSPIQRQILKPLSKFQEEADQDYDWAISEYEVDLREWELTKKEERCDRPRKPTPHEYHTADATREALARIQSQQSTRGLLVTPDELAGLFKGQNQYRNGRGNDKESLLTAFDGAGLKVDRASGFRISIPRTSLSITGTIQPDILRGMMGDFSDASGQWARFLWCLLPLKSAPFPRSTVRYDISERLYDVYRQLAELTPRCYQLTPEAKVLYADWYDQLDQRRVTETHQGLQAVYSKMQGYTGRLALILHCLNASVDGCLPAEGVSAKTMTAAIKLTRWFIGQVKLLYAEGDTVDGALEPVYTKLIRLSRVRGWLRAKDVRNYERSLRKASSDIIRSHFRELEAMGYGETRGMGNRLQWRAMVDEVDRRDGGVDERSTAEKSDKSDFQGNGRRVDRVDTVTAEQGVYLSTEIAKSCDIQGIRMVDGVSTNDLHADGMSTEDVSLENKAVQVETDEPRLKVGDICQYIGSGLKMLKGLNQLRIEAIEEGIAVVKGPGWYVSHQVSLSDLALNLYA
ncbi:bifunctional dna primase polymerase famiily protein [Leptolyngbya sp. Heron Island J]|uniref:DUF3987 domain-containing protein n=1 Tax=Leptolyngbya sp. Heron Island J TaxID=1385935 RepID=UPI0003B93867|nr:DUF3987 domain-containing protein [Leptolyngbya sp. Heron Island J]ESA34122.1 bifunctional dna primase polymerase famiily protein [Leptolyngbya sp. Heron Island J]